MDQLDQKLSVVTVGAIGGTDLFEIHLLCLLQLLLEEQGDLFDISTGSHAKNNANCLSPDLHVSATGKVSLVQGKLESLHLVKI